MNPRISLFTIAVAFLISAPLRLCASILFLCSTVFAAQQPNVILIVTDDQGYGDVSAHGSPVLKTPNLDAFRDGAVRFTDFHVAPMCSPTRGQLMTGIDAMRNGCTAVCQGRSMMRTELPTMANFFAGSGYTTGHFGKWHLGDSYPHRPQDRGFQETIHHRAWGITSLADHWENHTDVYFDPVLEHNGVDTKFEGYCTDIFFNEAMKWIALRQAQDPKQPFFCYLPTNTPHVPDVCADKYSKPYEGTHEGKPLPAKFYGMIANLDENLGKLEAFLETRGLRENTFVIYMSDNGTQSKGAQAIYNAGMRDRKTSVYEGGHRVPLFVRWPGGDLAHGKDIDELTQVQDLLPTLIELCGLKNESKEAFDGASLAGLLKGTTDELPDRKLVVQYRVSGEPWDPAVVLWDKWRLTKGKKKNAGMELYHVGRDPGQTKNVITKRPEVADAMQKHYEEWHAEAKTLFDRPRWITVGSEEANPMILYAQDWVGDYCDNPGGLSRATAQGYWNVIVDRAGVYEFQLRRWPAESKKTLTEGWAKGPGGEKASARPIAAANLQIAGANHTLDTKPGDTHATFRIQLPAGKTQLSTTFTDADGGALCSAIYTHVRRLDGNEAKPADGFAPEVTDLNAADVSFALEARLHDLKEPFISTAPHDRGDGIAVGKLGVHGGDKEAVLAFAKEIAAGDHGEIDSLLLYKDGVLLFESYYRRGRANYPHYQMSITKSYTAMAIGRAIKLGHLSSASLDKPVLSFLTGIERKNLVEGAAAITLAEAMNMRSGIRVDKARAGKILRDDPDRLLGQGQIQTYLELSEPIPPSPRQFKYQGSDPSMAMQVLETAVPGGARAFIETELLGKLGITNFAWQDDVSGLPKSAAGSSMRSRDMIKWGHLVLNNGRWNQEQLIPSEFIERATDRLHTNARGTSYGFFWWRHDAEVDGRKFDCISGRGAGGQFILIFPELDLVAAVTAHNKGMGTIPKTLPQRILPGFLKE